MRMMFLFQVPLLTVLILKIFSLFLNIFFPKTFSKICDIFLAMIIVRSFSTLNLMHWSCTNYSCSRSDNFHLIFVTETNFSYFSIFLHTWVFLVLLELPQ